MVVESVVLLLFLAYCVVSYIIMGFVLANESQEEMETFGVDPVVAARLFWWALSPVTLPIYFLVLPLDAFLSREEEAREEA